jgi:hypothetical protein
MNNTGAIWGDLFKDPPPKPRSPQAIRIQVVCISCGEATWVHRWEKYHRTCKGTLYQ